MEISAGKKHVAIIERCMMSEAGLRHLFASPAMKSYHFHFFNSHKAFVEAQKKTPFFSVIYSLSSMRELRRECLLCLHALSLTNPGIQRIVLADDDREARLVSRLSPSRLHGVLSKSASLPILLGHICTLLGETRRVNENVVNHWYVSQNRTLSPTERAILQCMTRGLSMPEIAVHLERNIKTIRAHKFNAMAKLGVNSDVGLLNAADILTWVPAAAALKGAQSLA
jgi:DNA-binding NarL/FixJ family response regulator